MTGPTCATCRFWVKWTETPPMGTCHRYPPTCGEDSVDSHHVSTDYDDWCGEHEPVKEGE